MMYFAILLQSSFAFGLDPIVPPRPGKNGGSSTIEDLAKTLADQKEEPPRMIRLKSEAQGWRLDICEKDGKECVVIGSAMTDRQLELIEQHLQAQNFGTTTLLLSSGLGLLWSAKNNFFIFEQTRKARLRAFHEVNCDRMYATIAEQDSIGRAAIRGAAKSTAGLILVTVGLAGPNPEKQKKLGEALQNAKANPGKLVKLESYDNAPDILELHEILSRLRERWTD